MGKESSGTEPPEPQLQCEKEQSAALRVRGFICEVPGFVPLFLFFLFSGRGLRKGRLRVDSLPETTFLKL